MFTKIKNTFREYPKAFKVLVLATFIDRLGGFLLFPFYSLYITEHFGVTMIEVGSLFSFLAVGNLLGGIIGGALADKYGRRIMILIGLTVSGLGNILLGIINELYLFYIIAVFLGFVGNFGGPARQAMVVDLLPKEKQAEGFGIIRVAFNVSAVIAPILGGFLAVYSYMFLFIADAVSSIITALIVYLVIPETKPPRSDDEPEDTVMKTIKGYKEVLKDLQYLLFISILAITVLVYMQMNTTLSVFLRDVHGLTPQYFGLILSLNAILVVFFQFWVTRKISKFAPMKIMALGSLFLMVGFGMYGFVSEIYLFFIAMAIVTVGEMLVFPLGQVVAASFAPEDKRGRYMAVLALQWTIPSMFGVLAAGLVMEHVGPMWVWYFAGILAIVASIGFLLIHKITKRRFSIEIEPPDELLVEELQHP
jgi:MFS family permease